MNKIKKFYKQTSRRWTWLLYRKRNILKNKIENFMADNVKLHLGCGDKKLEGYVNIDIVPLEGTDVVMDISKELHLIPSSIAAEIRLESVFEHFYRYQQEGVLRECHRILKKDAKLVIRWLPDFDAIVKAYLGKEKGIVGEIFDLFNVYRYTHGEPEPRNSPYQLHKDIFTKDSIRKLLESNGFKIESMKNEIFDSEEIPVSINIIAAKR